MGLMLSILAACVGVLEFLEIVSNIIANVAVPNLNYSSEVTSPGLGSTSVLHSEDIEIECPSTILHDTSKTATTKRFLVTEQEDDNVSTRRFVVSDKEQPRNDLIPEFLITQHDTNESRRLLLIDKNEKNRNKSPLPLPKQFIITKTDNQVTQKALKSVKQGVGIEITSLSVKKENTTREKHQSLSFEEVSSFGETLPKALRNPENLSSLVYSNNSSTSTSFGSNSELNDIFDSSTKLKTSQQLEVHDTKEVCNRPSSPYPNLEVAVTKISSGPDLLENPSISLKESDEDLYKSRSASPQKVDIILQSTHFNTTQYWTNKILVEPIRKSTAPCARKIRNKELKRSKSASNLDDQEEDTGVRKTLSTTDLENESKDEQNLNSYETTFLNTLDGVASRKLSRDKSMRRSYKRKSKTTDLDLREKDLKNSRDCSSNGKNSDLIFSGEYTKAMNKEWHGQHFCCWQCDESLTGQRYVLREEHPYCVSCYESVFANACESCNRIIGIDSKDLSYKDKHWHEACFLCTTCGESLVDKQFGSKGDRIYCGRCYDNQFASRCDGCNEIFRAGTKKMEYKTRQWHEKCFCCCVCKVPIGTQSFIPREQEIYCAKCYEEKFATRCIKCNKVITSGGVTYKNDPWHRECFTCTHCSKSLAGERFTSRDEKPYCAECFGELFAKRCFACSKPITGIGGTKFISFEDRHWHNDCFFCASCRTSLVGRGFITDQDDIICPECAKQKLM